MIIRTTKELRKYLQEKLRISEDDLDTDVQVIIQASNGYYEGEESISWLQGNSSNATIISDGSGLVPTRNVYLAYSTAIPILLLILV